MSYSGERRWRYGRCVRCKRVYRWKYRPRQYAAPGVRGSETSEVTRSFLRSRCWESTCGASVPLKPIREATWLKTNPKYQRDAPRFVEGE